jgi:hypothetical protein
MNRMTWSGARATPYLALAGLTLGLILLAPGVARAAAPTRYKIQLIAQSGDKVGEAQINADGHFYLGSLNDRGQIVFGADSGSGELLAEYSDGKLKPIVTPGRPSPNGTWPMDVGILDPASINQRGNIAFATAKPGGGLVLVWVCTDGTTRRSRSRPSPCRGRPPSTT